jgi:ribonuclease P protein component
VLTSREQFGHVYREGRSWAGKLAVLKALPNRRDVTRCGITVSRRVGKAVARNRVKRRLREIIRQAPLQPGWDIVIIARAAAAEADYGNLEKSARGLLLRAGLITGEYEEVSPGAN